MIQDPSISEPDCFSSPAPLFSPPDISPSSPDRQNPISKLVATITSHTYSNSNLESATSEHEKLVEAEEIRLSLIELAEGVTVPSVYVFIWANPRSGNRQGEMLVENINLQHFRLKSHPSVQVSFPFSCLRNTTTVLLNILNPSSSPSLLSLSISLSLSLFLSISLLLFCIDLSGSNLQSLGPRRQKARFGLLEFPFESQTGQDSNS